MVRKYGIGRGSVMHGVLVIAAVTFGCSSPVVTVGDLRAKSQDGGGTPPAQQASIILPSGASWTPTPPACREGALYEVWPNPPPDFPSSIPTDCQNPVPPFSTTICNALHESPEASGRRAGLDMSREDAGLGLAPDGSLRMPRQDGDLPLLSPTSVVQSGTAGTFYGTCEPLFYLAYCHHDGFVGVTWDCGDVPAGGGGSIAPGIYALTGYVLFQSDTGPHVGAHISQTVAIGTSSALVVSDDDNNFDFIGTFTYSVDGNRITFQSVCENQTPQYRAFPASASFAVSGSTLEFFDDTRRVRSTFVRVE